MGNGSISIDQPGVAGSAVRALYFKDYHTGLSPPEGPYGAQALQGGAYEIPAPLAMCHRHPRRGRAANNCTNCFCGFKRKCETISITFKFASQNSSDLSSGRRPTSKSAEFCDANVIVVEQKRCENTDVAVKLCSYRRRDPPGRCGGDERRPVAT